MREGCWGQSVGGFWVNYCRSLIQSGNGRGRPRHRRLHSRRTPIQLRRGLHLQRPPLDVHLITPRRLPHFIDSTRHLHGTIVALRHEGGLWLFRNHRELRPRHRKSRTGHPLILSHLLNLFIESTGISRIEQSVTTKIFKMELAGKLEKARLELLDRFPGQL